MLFLAGFILIWGTIDECIEEPEWQDDTLTLLSVEIDDEDPDRDENDYAEGQHNAAEDGVFVEQATVLPVQEALDRCLNKCLP